MLRALLVQPEAQTTAEIPYANLLDLLMHLSPLLHSQNEREVHFLEQLNPGLRQPSSFVQGTLLSDELSQNALLRIKGHRTSALA